MPCPDGDSCSEYWQCSGGFCRDGKCASCSNGQPAPCPAKDRDPCETPAQCDNGLCFGNDLIGYKCGKQPSNLPEISFFPFFFFELYLVSDNYRSCTEHRGARMLRWLSSSLRRWKQLSR